MRLTENLTSPNTGSPSNPKWDFQMVTFISQRVFLSLQQSSPWCNGEKLRRAHPLEQPLSLSPRLNGVQSAIRGWISVRKGCQSSARVNDIHAVAAGLPQGALWEGHLFSLGGFQFIVWIFLVLYTTVLHRGRREHYIYARFKLLQAPSNKFTQGSRVSKP